MMCSLAPIAPPAWCFTGADVAPMMATYAVEAPPLSPCMYVGMDEMDEYSREIDAFLQRQHTPTPPPMQDMFLEVSLLLRRGMRTMQIAATDLVAGAHHDEPTTPVADLRAPNTYGNDIDAAAPAESVIKNKTEETSSAKNTNKKMQDPSWTYDANIDATFREMETDPAERPLADSDLWEMQKMTMADRAHLVELIYACSRIRRLPPGTLHRAVNYLDRYLSVKKIRQEDRILLAITAMFAAAKFESSNWVFNADDVAIDVGNGCTRSQVLAMERDLVATLGYNLSGPTADTFVDHFTRHDDEKGKIAQVIRYLAHNLADVTLLDYRCVHSLPSAVAASAILLASRVIVNSDKAEEELLKKMGYKLEDLTNIIDDIYEMHELEGMWPGCALMTANRAFGYYLPPRYC